MGIGKRAAIASLALVTSLLAAGATVIPAYANQPVDGLAAAAPNTSPAAAVRQYLPPGSPNVHCSVGYACASVPYGGNGGYYWFKFYNYGTYTLSNWYGVGGADNTQGFGAAMRILGANGQQRACVAPPVRDLFDWTPVYYIKLTAAPC